jgi:hypothetical protein
MKGTFTKLLLVVLILVGIIWYMSYRGGKSPVYVIIHFPQEVNALFQSLFEKNRDVQESQLEIY